MSTFWGKTDNAANSDMAALIQVGSNTANAVARTALFNNVTANVFMRSAQGNVVVGQFGVSNNEIRAARAQRGSRPQHSGWVLRHEGRGLKAGRVWYETLVATGTIESDAADDIYFPDFAIVISSNASSNTIATAQNVNFTVSAASVPAGATLRYFWQKNDGAGWANVANTAGQYFNNTSPTLIANNVTANGNVFRVLVMTTGANNVFSSNATIRRIV